MSWFVYIIECKDCKLYTGITTDLKRRLRQHNSGNGGRFTSIRWPVKLRYSEEVPGKPEALVREARIKRLPRLRKLSLIKDSKKRTPDKSIRITRTV